MFMTHLIGVKKVCILKTHKSVNCIILLYLNMINIVIFDFF